MEILNKGIEEEKYEERRGRRAVKSRGQGNKKVTYLLQSLLW